MKERTVAKGIRLEPKTIKEVKKLAINEERTFSNMLQRLVKEAVKNRKEYLEKLA